MQYFTSDWHIGEKPAPNTHSFLRRLKPLEVLAQEWLQQCHTLITPDDILYIIGDLAITLDDLDFYAKLPECEKRIILGDKETDSKNYTFDEWCHKMNQVLGDVGSKNNWYFDHSWDVEIGGHSFRVAHKPVDCMATPSPSLLSAVTSTAFGAHNVCPTASPLSMSASTPGAESFPKI